MDKYTATELAYKNDYEKGYKEGKQQAHQSDPGRKLIDPQPIIRQLADRCLLTRGLECSVLGDVIDLLKSAPDAREGR